MRKRHKVKRAGGDFIYEREPRRKEEGGERHERGEREQERERGRQKEEKGGVFFLCED